MSTEVFTHATCERCGEKWERKGDYEPSTYPSWWRIWLEQNGSAYGKRHKFLCPGCGKAALAFVDENPEVATVNEGGTD